MVNVPKINLTRLEPIFGKYQQKLLQEIQEHEHGSDDESILHIEQLSKAGQGDEGAKKYVLEHIKTKLSNILEKEDLKEIKAIVLEEYKKFIDKKYEKFERDADYISYYQLLEECLQEEELHELLNMNLDKIIGIDEFTLYCYQRTYGPGHLDNLLELNINNMEVHGTRKVRVETNTGLWKTIENYKFDRDEEIVRVARRLLAQEDKQDITEINCEMESMLSNGQRVSVALKHANKEHMIFIKKFDSVEVTTMDDLVKIGTITPEIKRELEIYAKGRANIAFIGGVNTGKTTTLRSYVGLIPDKYKIGIVEGDFETDWQGIFPEKDFVVLKETAQYSLSEQFMRMLRMNRNIMGIGEARGAEVEQFVEGATRGSDGSFLTTHTRTAYDLIDNIAWMHLKNGVAVDIRFLRMRVASAIDIVVRQWHSADGRRLVDEIYEIEKVRDNLDMPFKVNSIYKRDLKTNKVKKVEGGCISKQLAEKFSYYNVTWKELEEIGYKEDDDKQYS